MSNSITSKPKERFSNLPFGSNSMFQPSFYGTIGPVRTEESVDSYTLISTHEVTACVKHQGKQPSRLDQGPAFRIYPVRVKKT
jgi:hypothetical protein